MTDELEFMMGQHRAAVPTDRFYCKRHMWLQLIDGEKDVYRVGFTSYSVRLLQDVYFLEWSVDEGVKIADRQEIGEVESSKAVSTMYSPCAGELVAFNESLLNDPSAINADCYGAGFLYRFRTDSPLLTPESYVELLQSVWEDTQRTIKGQMN